MYIGAVRRVLVHDMARTTCLYADQVLLPDALTVALFHYLQDPKPDILTGVQTAFAAVQEMSPLLEHGVVALSRPPKGLCQWCDSDRLRATESAVEHVAEELIGSITGAMMKPLSAPGSYMLVVESPLLEMDGFSLRFGPEFSTENGPREPVAVGVDDARALLEKTRDGLLDFVRTELRTVGGDMRASAEEKATLSTNFRLSVVGARAIQNKPVSSSRLPDFEHRRALRLPWFDRLTPDQVLRLKERAGSALPAFRAYLGQAVRGENGDDDAVLANLIADLRRQTQEVESELKAAAQLGGGIKTAVLAGLSFTLGLYGAYQGLVGGSLPLAVSAAGAALTAAGTADKRRSDAAACHTKLTSHPGYLLLTAERISEHAH
jgi:hypothetical protein